MSIGRPLSALLLGLALAVGVTAVTSMPSYAASPAAGKRVAHVTIQNVSFTPAILKIKAGTTVMWINKDGMGHTVTGTRGHWGSGSLAHGHTYAYRFTRAGVYTYVCAIHPNMKATVIVAH